MAYPLEENGFSSILEALDENRIVNFRVDGRFLVMGESCDGYFKRALTKEQFGRFIKALQEIHDKMPDL